MKKVIVLSLGGSLIVPKKIDYKFLSNFKSILEKNYNNYKFVIVCGGGKIARKYISILKKQNKSIEQQSLAGIRATRMNAKLLMQIFGKKSNQTLPKSMKQVKNNLAKNSVVFCGALRYAPNETSDGTAAKLANYLNCKFVNLTNIPGLYTSNPKTNKNAKFIPKISWKDFEKQASRIKYKPGQHFVLDQHAAKTIKKYRIPTYILGPKLSNLQNLLNNKKFKGTTIQ